MRLVRQRPARGRPGTGRLTVWDVDSRSSVVGRSVSLRSVGSVSISADKTRSPRPPGRRGLWDAATSGARPGREGSGSDPGAVAFSPTEPPASRWWSPTGPVEGGRASRSGTCSAPASRRWSTVAGHGGYVLGWTVPSARTAVALDRRRRPSHSLLWDVAHWNAPSRLEQNVGGVVARVQPRWERARHLSAAIPSLPAVTSTGEPAGPRLGGVGSREARLDVPDGDPPR
jgi:hypothetical protein